MDLRFHHEFVVGEEKYRHTTTMCAYRHASHMNPFRLSAENGYIHDWLKISISFWGNGGGG